MKTSTLFLLTCAMLCPLTWGQIPDYQNSKLATETRVEDLLARMSLEEKVAQLTTSRSVMQLKLDDAGQIDEQSLDQFYQGISVGTFSSPKIGYLQIAQYSQAIDHYMRTKTRLGIPAIQNSESIHGIMSYGVTMFPQAIAQGATWNRELVKAAASAIAEEASLCGADQAFSPVFDLARDPRWGRVEECYGEDPYHAKEMGCAFVIGMQGEAEQSKIGLAEGKMASTVKHFAAYAKCDGGLNLAPAAVGERELREIHFYPVKGAIDEANVYCIMAGYHEIDGIPAHANSWLLRDVLRDEWGFKGYVVSDGVGIHMLQSLHKVAKDPADAAQIAVNAGVDLEIPDRFNYQHLVAQVKAGKVEEATIDQAVRNVLSTKFKMGLFERPYSVPADLAERIHTPQHLALAQSIAEESITLLKNQNNILPLDRNKAQRIAIIGPNANRVQLGDISVTRHIDAGISVWEGMQEYLADSPVSIKYAEGCGITNLSKEGFEQAAQLAQESDVVILVTGGTSVIYPGLPIPEDDADSRARSTCGEGYDRHELDFPGVQPELIELIAKQGKALILVNISGRAYTMTKQVEQVNALVQAWYPGEMGGRAIARILFGEVNPSGRLTVTFPQHVGHIPMVYNDKPSNRGFYKSPGTPEKLGRDYVHSTPAPLFCFGYGLSYTNFSYSDLQVENKLEEEGILRVHFKLKNTGKRAGAETAQIYVNDVLSSVTTPRIALKNFAKIYLQAGEEQSLSLDIKKEDLMLWDASMKAKLESGTFDIMVGASCEDIKLKTSIDL